MTIASRPHVHSAPNALLGRVGERLLEAKDSAMTVGFVGGEGDAAAQARGERSEFPPLSNPGAHLLFETLSTATCYC